MQCVMFYGHSMFPGVFKSAGPFRLATALREAGYETQCVDVGPIGSKYHPVIDKIIDKFVGPDTLWVGISTTFLIQVFGVPVARFNGGKAEGDDYLQHVIDRCRQRSPNVKFITGGSVYLNLEAYGFYRLDGFADTEIIEFSKWCEGKPAQLTRIGKSITGNEYKDFATSTIKWEVQDIIRPDDVLPLETARGCIFRCKFCAYPLNGKSKGEWIKRADVLREEMTYNYETFGIQQYMLADDTYNDTTDKVRTLYEQVFSKLPFKPDLTAYLRLDLLHRFPEQEEMLVGSGLRSALFGLETNNDASARAIGKGMPFAKQVAYMHKLKATTFSDTLISSGFILGLPYDTRESIQQLREFLLSTDNPVEDWIVRPLALNPVNTAHKRKFYSEFDLDHEKYGYEYLGTEGGDYAAVFRQRWRLKSADLTSDECLKLADEMMNECNDLPNFKYGSGGYCRMRTIIPAHEVRSKSRKQLHTEYDIPALERARVLDYYNRLLQL